MAVKTRLATLLLLLLWKAEAANPVTCYAVTTRYNTTVVCDFGLDISQSQHGFNVQFYDRDNTAQAKTVLACNFIEGGDLVCHEGSGIKFSKNKVSDQIQVIGPPAMDKVGGRYACQLAPAVGRIETCTLTYKDIPTEPPATSEIHTSERERIGSTSIVYLLKVIVGLLIVVIIIILGALSVCGMLYWKRERDRGSGSTRPSQGDIEATERHGSRDALNKRSIPFFCWDAQKEQRNKQDKGDPGREANQMESASTGDPMLHPPPSLMAEEIQSLVPSGPAAQGLVEGVFFDTTHEEPYPEIQFLVPSGPAAQGLVEGVFFDTTHEEPYPNEEPPEETPVRKKKKGVLGRLIPFKKEKGKADQQQKVPKAEPRREREATKDNIEEMTKQRTDV